MKTWHKWGIGIGGGVILFFTIPANIFMALALNTAGIMYTIIGACFTYYMFRQIQKSRKSKK